MTDEYTRTLMWHMAEKAADEAQENLKVAMREMVACHQRWQTFTTNMRNHSTVMRDSEQHATDLWEKFTDASDAWSIAMATFRIRRRREEKLRP